MKIDKLRWVAEYTCPVCWTAADRVPEQALPVCQVCTRSPPVQMLPSRRGAVHDNWKDHHRGRLLRMGDWDQLEEVLRQTPRDRLRLAVRRERLLAEARELESQIEALDEKLFQAAASLFYPHEDVQDYRTEKEQGTGGVVREGQGNSEGV